ncbi:MAG: hypothetical protein EOP88_10640 [Verrucomicrobiaceae bacterium]|nr:MAG: hypothetical protein EOP88_10640 [Verrucomicrobiaceae bacterium]
MSTPTFLSTFPRQLRYWTFHCTLNALPSFGIALWILGLRNDPAAIAAMASAVVTFILLYSTITSVRSPFSQEAHILSRALKLGAKIRAWTSAISIPLAFTPVLIFLPDLWCGLFATIIVNQTMVLPGDPVPFNPGMESSPGFAPVYVATMIEGFLLSGILLCISFLAIVFLQWRDRYRLYEEAANR